jgi:hypothetical protein
MISMQSCNHAFMPYHSNSPLFPSFLSSQLPSFPLYPLVAKNFSIFIAYFFQIWYNIYYAKSDGAEIGRIP